MTKVKYGVNVFSGPTKGQPPLQVDSEITAIVGAFPADTGAGNEIGKSKEWYACTSWEDFLSKYGGEETWGAGNLNRSDGWNAFKSVKTIMKTFGVRPVLIYNVIDPDEHDADVTDELQTFATGIEFVTLDEKYGMLSSVVITDSPMTVTYVIDVDYTLTRNANTGLIEVNRVATGGIGATDPILADYTTIDPTAITQVEVDTAIQGCNNIITTLGFSKLPGWLHVPYWSMKDWNNIEHLTVRNDQLAMSANLNTVFYLRFIYDLDETAYAASGDLADLYAEKSILSEYGRACAGGGVYGVETEQLESDWYIGMLAQEVEANGYPGASPSNRVMIGFDPTNKLTFPTQSNAVRDKGIICTVLDTGDRGWNIWGTWTSYFNGTATDLRMDSTNQNDVIVYLNKSITRDLWIKSQDRNFNKFTIQAYIDGQNTLGKQLVARGQMIGFEIVFREEDNPDLSQQVNLRLFLLAPEPQKRTDVEMQVDLAYFNTLFG